MSTNEGEVIPDLVREQFTREGIPIHDLTVRAYPDEVNYIVYVDEADLSRAAVIGNRLDEELDGLGLGKSFVIVRKVAAEKLAERAALGLSKGVQDPRVTDLTRLISARSRVSLAQPSLAYVRDVQANISAATAGRHHLIFGRRGAGKSALLVEARRQVEAEGAIASWVNLQTLRHEPPGRVVLYIFEEMLSDLISNQRVVRAESVVSVDLAQLYDKVRSLLGESGDSLEVVTSLVPRMQRAISRFLELEQGSLYIFIDDFYYMPRDRQPLALDLLHGCVRDTRAWLKIASIRHLTRWFQSSPPLGLQTIHDAELIDLDVTLQDPGRAQGFLENVLGEYARRVGIHNLNRIFRSDALGRLVLASGAVPRDYLVLASSSIGKAQNRQNARLVGVQDVNQAAGDAAGAKIQELEDDMASNIGTADRTLNVLTVVRKFCLEEKNYTYFLVDYRDKEEHANEYSLLTDLMDVRLVHLLDSGVSDSHAAGQRSEAFMLDLSQFSGSRLKQRIQVLEFSGGRIVSRQTRTSQAPRSGDTPRQVISILRGAPTFSLSRVSETLSM
jgi:AAA ATPase domain